MSSKGISLRQTMKERLLGLFEGVKADRKLVVIDERSLRVVDAVCNFSDILDCGVFLVESLERSRQPYPSMDAIYLISPDPSSVRAIVKDFERVSGPLYAHAHIFSLNEIPKELFSELTGCPQLAQRVEGLQQVYSDFMATEARFFHFGSSPIKQLFGNTGITPQVLTELDKMAKRLLSVWVALGEIPVVKYFRSDGDLLSPKLAGLLQEYLESHASKIGLTGGPKGNAEIIIFSRTFDLLSPVLHEFTYQAMAADLLGIQEEDDSGAMKYSVDSGKTASALDECDSLWQALRHNHIAETSNLIVQKFTAFTNENKAAMKAASKSNGGPDEKVGSLADLKETLNAMGEFHELKTMYSMHMAMAQACFSAMSSKHLMDVAKIEQILATGRDEEDDTIKPSTQWPSVSNLLTQNYLSKEDKLRLAIIYALCTGDIEESVLSRCSFDQSDIALVKRCRDFGQKAIAARLPQKKSKSLPEYEVSRFIPSVKYAIEAALVNNLDQSLYPSVRPASSSSGKTGAVSLRSGGAASTSTSNQRIIMAFIIGGASHSEVRVAYETSDIGKGEVIVGSTHLMHPEMFLRSMRSD